VVHPSGGLLGDGASRLPKRCAAHRFANWSTRERAGRWTPCGAARGRVAPGSNPEAHRDVLAGAGTLPEA
jgi:hypothetical protein